MRACPSRQGTHRDAARAPQHRGVVRRGDAEAKRLALHAQFPDAEHPVVRTHPETGEKVLFVNAFTTHFTNYHTAENVRVGQDYAPGASQLLQYLVSQAFVPEYQVRFRWKPNSVAMWDNRSTQHYAVMDYPPCHRKMERAGIVGDRPSSGTRTKNRRRSARNGATRTAMRH
jgi:alpha-ketoglutarate-dependent taurine dioxygenase